MDPRTLPTLEQQIYAAAWGAEFARASTGSVVATAFDFAAFAAKGVAEAAVRRFREQSPGQQEKS